MALEIIELNHVNVTVERSLEGAAKHFYGTVLGLEEIPKPEENRKHGGAWYRIGLVQLHLSVDDGAAGEGASRRHVCYVVKDAWEAERELRAAGLEIIPDDRPMAGWKRFYVRDPGGNQLEIAQRL
jgi:catechol 2,3-dioxygenase-like lactoylglutathione lyase family enzyme